MRRKREPEVTPPMQLLISMLRTCTDETEHRILMAKLHEVLTYGQIRGVWVVKK